MLSKVTTPAANCPIVACIYLFTFKHSTFSFHKNKCLEYLIYKHFSVFSLFVGCFSSGEPQLLTPREKPTRSRHCRSQAGGCWHLTRSLIRNFVEVIFKKYIHFPTFFINLFRELTNSLEHCYIRWKGTLYNFPYLLDFY